MAEEAVVGVEFLDVLTKTGLKTGICKPRGDVHRDGDYHRAVHVLIYSESTHELLLQKRADCKDSWPGQWDISSAGHISAGDSSLISARRELQEELGVDLPEDAFELLFIFIQECVINDGTFINNEFNDVYLVTTVAPIPLEAFSLQELEVSAVKYISCEEYKSLLALKDPDYVPYDVNGQYGQLFDIIAQRCKENMEERSLALQKQLNRYASIPLSAELGGLSDTDKEALRLILKASMIIDDIFHHQVCVSNPDLRDWLKEQADTSLLSKLKWKYFAINKSPWSSLDESQAFLTTADSAIKLYSHATKSVPGWKGVVYKAAFPLLKPPGANFYPSDMDKLEFESWRNSLSEDKRQDAVGFFSVIKRTNGNNLDAQSGGGNTVQLNHDLYCVPFSHEYESYLVKASELLHQAGELTSFPSLKRLLHSKADAFLSNDYYDSDIAWMELDSKLDVTIGPYETYEDTLFGYKYHITVCLHSTSTCCLNQNGRIGVLNPEKSSVFIIGISIARSMEQQKKFSDATFEAFIGVRDDDATEKLKLFGDHLLVLEQNLPMNEKFKSKDVTAASIRVIQLLFSAGDVKGPQTVAFNLPNDERIVKDRGTSMVMLKNVSEAKFKHILLPIAEACISKEQQHLVDFESFFTHTICHECCHGIGPHSIVLPDGRKSTVRLELQEQHSALEEAKADIVGLWALNFFIDQNLLPSSMCKSMYVSFLAGCFRSVRFGLDEAHGKGQALQFNWLFQNEAFILHPDGRFSVNFDKIKDAVEGLSQQILTIQATGDKDAASSLFQEYCKMTDPLRLALDKLEKIEVPVDITPTFTVADDILRGRP